MKNALVTGVGDTFSYGAAAAQRLLEAGYRVACVDKQRLEGDHPLQQFRDAKRLSFFDADLSNSEDCKRLMLSCASFFNDEKIQVCVVSVCNCAPYMPEEPRERVEHFRQTLEAVLTMPFVLCELLGPHLSVTPPASIVHVSDLHAVLGEENCEALSTAKAGLLGLTVAQAASLKGRARVNAVIPGYIQADFLEGAGRHANLLEREGSVEDVAEMILFLADNSTSGFITGQHFRVDGGGCARMHI